MQHARGSRSQDNPNTVKGQSGRCNPTGHGLALFYEFEGIPILNYFVPTDEI